MISLKGPFPRCRSLQRLLCREDGVAAVEFALLAPVFFAALLGVMELGRIVFTVAALHHAAEEGTRYAIVNMGTATDEMIHAHASSGLAGVVDGKTAVITSTAPVDAVTGSKIVSVRVQLDYQPWFDFLVPVFTLAGESKGFIAFNYGS